MELRLNCIVVTLLLISTMFESATAAKNKIIFNKGNVELSYKKIRKTIKVELAEKQEQHAHGLMFRKKLKTNEGMLFIFSDEQLCAFWMKNTLIDLDIGYFSKKNILIDIQQMAAENSVMQLSVLSYPNKHPAMYALEMAKGWFKKNSFPEGTTLKIISRP